MNRSGRRLFTMWLVALLALPGGVAVDAAAQEPATDSGTAPTSTPDTGAR